MIDDELAFAGRDKCAVAGIGADRLQPRLGPQRAVAGHPGVAGGDRRRRADAAATSTASCAATWTSCGPTTSSTPLGMKRLDYCGDAGPGGVAPCAMVGQAMAAVISGQATNVLVLRSLNGRSRAPLRAQPA